MTTTQPWQGDISLDLELITRLIERQHPELQIDTLELLGSGWDNLAVFVNERWVFRFPRRAVAARWFGVETRCLPLIAPHLPLPIPVPRFIGRPTEEYPYLFHGYEALPGQTACRVDLSTIDLHQQAVALGGFLSTLHGIPIDEATREAAPRDEIGRTDLAQRLRLLEARFDELDHRPDAEGWPEVASEVRRELQQLALSPPSIQPVCWVHGDLYARHLIIDAQGRLCGVIDWGDVHLGDAALDLSIAFSFLPPEHRPAFFEAYQHTRSLDETTLARARFRALTYGVILMHYGLSIGDVALVAAGRRALTLARR